MRTARKILALLTSRSPRVLLGSLAGSYLLLLTGGCGSGTSPQQPATPTQAARPAAAPAATAARVRPPASPDEARPDTLTFTTQPGFAADEAILRHDTLLVVASSLNVLYPLGQVEHAADIRQRYPQFKLTRGSEQANGIIYTYTLFKYKHSIIKFYDNEEDGATIVAGHITDPEIVLQNTLHSGMSLTQVLHTFFARIDQNKLQQVRVIRVDSGLAAIKYFYNFYDMKLQSIKLDSYSVMSKEL